MHEVVTNKALCREAKKMAKGYNEAVLSAEPARRAYNQDVRRRYEAGEFDNASEALAAYKQPPPLAQGKFTKNWVWKFKSDWGHLDKETNTHGVFMEPQDAQMVNMRDQENARLQEEKSSTAFYSFMISCGKRTTEVKTQGLQGQKVVRPALWQNQRTAKKVGAQTAKRP